jgi:hypothetical protein
MSAKQHAAHVHHFFLLLVPFFLVTIVLALLVSGGHAGANSGRPLSATLTGAAEINGGDPDGSGTATLTLNEGQGEICFTFTVANLATVTGVHIHKAPVGQNGPIVVPLNALSGCVNADPALIKDIRQHPEAYYVNVHTTEFPGGAIRGQLSK